jgi:uncharacterized small protein (DUF1192 family)
VDDDLNDKRPGSRKGTEFTKEPLDALSVHELEDRIDLLQGEIIRVQEMIKSKQSSKAAAEGFFKK